MVDSPSVVESPVVEDRGAPGRLSPLISISFGAGTIGTAILLNAVTTFFPTMMSTVLGQSAALAGLLLTASKLYDIAADLTIGAASDRTRTRWGRRRPYLLFGTLISAVSFFMIFSPPHLGGTALVVYMLAALVIYSTGYSLFNVPYVAMPAEMTEGYHERTRLLSYRTFFAAVGQLIALAATAAVITWAGGGAHGYMIMGLTMAVLIAASMLATFFGTARARFTERVHRPGLGVLRQIGLLTTNKPLMLLMGTKFLQFLSLASVTSTGLLFRLNVLKVGYQGQIHLAVVQNVVTGLSMPAWVWLGRRFGKKWTYIAAILVYGAGALSWLWAKPGMPLSSIWIRGAVQGFGVGGMLLMSISMLPDTMEFDWKRTGLRREGVFSSLYAIVEKVGYAVGPGLVGIYLAASGYISTTRGKLVTQPPGAVQALYMTNTVIPVALLLGSIALIFFYNLDQDRVEGMAAIGDG